MPPAKQHNQPEVVGTLPDGVGLSIGAPVPPMQLPAADGSVVSLQDFFKASPQLLVFYRGGWCPFCNFQIRELTLAWPEFQRRGVGIVAISVDSVESAAATRATYTIPFPVLSDPDLSAHRAFAVVQPVDLSEFERLKGYGMDLEKASGRTHHSIAIPSMFLVDSSGIVRWAHADRDYKTRPTLSQIFAAIDAIAPQ